ncbi:related to low affininty zinc transporter [Rhynchosporium secalis]|uniref:Related to low affininty zinc transporter n=1 Tax=Rhynchosporium secalis TaxID=38038 RepID=A0A1E1MU25_RHYSE|nr:related to low affininty zinc transporter [Rhynchosporium secalis]
MSDAVTVKPQCGGGGANKDDYDLPLHVAALFLVLAFSIFGAGFPVVAKRVTWMKIPPKIFFFCKHFGTGVLIATAFVHLVPTAFASLTNPCLPDIFIVQYPAMPGVIMMAALFALFIIEMVLKAKTGGHSHGGPTGQDLVQHVPTQGRGLSAQGAPHGISAPVQYRNDHLEYPDEKDLAYVTDSYERKTSYPPHPLHRCNTSTNYGAESEMPPWFQVFFAQYVRQREEMKNMISAYTPGMAVAPPQLPSSIDPETAMMAAEPVIDVATYRKMNMNITLLEGGILFHSIFVGMTISITTDGFIVLLVAILFHQFFEGLGLGSRIAAVPYPKGNVRPWVLVCAFGLTCPIGQAIGLITRDSYDPDSAFALILVGVFNAISSGLLIFASCVDLLAEDFLSEEAQHLMTKNMKIWAFSYVLMGAAGMSVVGAFA